MDKISIIIADDHPIFLSGIRAELRSIENLTIAAEAKNGNEALLLIKKLQPDIAILDFQMPGLTGLEIAKELYQRQCHTKIILLTMHRDRRLIYTALDLGIKGFVLKDDAIIDILSAIKMVTDGRTYFSDSLVKLVLERMKESEQTSQKFLKIEKLTPTERKIVRLIGEFKSNDEIAAELFISKRTVENHRVNISDKFQLNGSRELLRFILENKRMLQLDYRT